MFSDLLKIILQQRMDFVTPEAWARRLKAFSEGQKIPRTSLGEKRLMFSDLGGDSHMKVTGMLVGKLELTP